MSVTVKDKSRADRIIIADSESQSKRSSGAVSAARSADLKHSTG